MLWPMDKNMIVLKFEKTSTSALVAHVDTLRAVIYIFRRAGVKVAYSQGFNPHMELGFSAPIALGTESVAEYVSAKAELEPNILERLNSFSQQGIKFTKVFVKDINLAAKLDSAKYIVTAAGIGNVVEQILADNYSITYTEKGQSVTKEVASKILSATRIDDDHAELILKVGNENLRPDRVVCHLMNVNALQGDYTIVKTEMFVGGVSADEFLSQE